MSVNLASFRKLIASVAGGAGTTGAVSALGSDKLTLIVGAISLVQSALVALAKNEPVKDKVDEVAVAANAYLDQCLAELAKSKA